ncbi:hypothetical protein FSP39_020631 [Pinctada imbricata]|uniref:Uncharacterized protein n=1 Tax=Pinctada imbricata TaxID=66713 RepID=A0AA89BZV2_PINIB|nr:hypothetical protein FSP39_020631 [Pinctada imbricata]
MQTIISRLRDDYKLLESDKHRLESANKQALERETLYTTKVQSLESDISEKENILRQLQDERTHIKAEFKAVHANKESLLTRLSEVAGAKLTEGNTEITDLSDPNRPTKIGERFREIYDNEWTEALEELTSKCVGITDRIAVEFLLNVMMKSFRFCSETLRIQADNCYRCFEEFPAPRSKDLQISMGERDTMPTISLKGTMRKRIDGIRKGVLSAMEPVAKEVVVTART